jgi:hypothetical protein
MITLTATITMDNGGTIEITPQNALSMERSIFDRADTTMPSWGIISNGGKVKFIDTDGTIRQLIEAKRLVKGIKVDLFLSDTVNVTSANIGDFYAKTWDYDNNNFNVSVDVGDELQNMQEVQAEPYVYDLTQEKYFITAKDLYDFIQADTVAKGFNMATSAELDSNTIAHLSAITIPIPYFEQANLWNVWQNFCEAFQTHIFKGKNKKIVCVYNGGN